MPPMGGGGYFTPQNLAHRDLNFNFTSQISTRLPVFTPQNLANSNT